MKMIPRRKAVNLLGELVHTTHDTSVVSLQTILHFNQGDMVPISGELESHFWFFDHVGMLD